eukprot:CAMPEP_0119108868 /NCGR_PEP_ID=MMETSP1180-20130426/15885_1 /TAXON_ID=3052 ORGANISM="Chlamydomonas cf sp, Strain CCMP681" /NCGR_SAMPLE_ID=MMETSP1180 /ASSEMBLY_ACC=CAM_ASM_000741 /LENGTH=151 /DNA_ID=CAMNT_0007094539 /DNA_START=94 /DNA_END=549 /DNA_ORIENTATION=+
MFCLLRQQAIQQPVCLMRLFASTAVVVPKDWSKVTIPAKTKEALSHETTVAGGQAFGNDLRGVSGLGLGDGITNHTDKWLSKGHKSPMQYIQEAPPILVEGPVVASHGTEDPTLGCPTEYINLKGTSKEHPAVCKYTGNRYYSLPHTWNHH